MNKSFKESLQEIDMSKLRSTINKVDIIVDLMKDYSRFNLVPNGMLPEISNAELLAYHKFCKLVGLDVAFNNLEKVLLFIEKDLKK